MFRVGLGSDIHKFADNRKLILGGVEIPYAQGLMGHSDADVVLHAISDALLGAAALGDLGKYFPSDEKNKNRASSEILREVCQMIWAKGYGVGNVDVVVTTEAPKLSGYRGKMKDKIATILNISRFEVSVKFTTTDGLGTIGRGEGVHAQAIVLIKKREM